MVQYAQRVLRRMATTVRLSKAYTGRANSFGFLRLCFAFAVVVGHTAVLGYMRPFSTHVDVPGLAVAGFFGISGFLITRSARRVSLPRFLWHRALRILPGLWVCLLFTGLVVAPTLWYLRYGDLDGLWRSPFGVVNYLRANWWGGLRQAGIEDLLVDTPYGRAAGMSMLNGSLWTLSYEIACYLIVAALAVLAILRRARVLVLLAAVLAFGVLVWNQYAQLRFGHPPVGVDGVLGPFPLFGAFAKLWFLRFGFMFLLGGVAELYGDRVPINDLLGVAALAAVGWFILRGELLGPALLPYEYLILWLAVRLPRVLHRIGQTNDYSYGVYIYSFLVQQVLAKYGAPRLGFVGYFAASAAIALALAFASWHLVEKLALRCKGWTPPLRRRPKQPPPAVDPARQPSAGDPSAGGPPVDPALSLPGSRSTA